MGSRLRPGTVKQDPNMMPGLQSQQPVQNMMQTDPRMGSAQGQDYMINRVLGQNPMVYGQPLRAEPTLNGQVMPDHSRKRLFRGGRY